MQFKDAIVIQRLLQYEYGLIMKGEEIAVACFKLCAIPAFELGTHQIGM
jgi:hypothetical protein